MATSGFPGWHDTHADGRDSGDGFPDLSRQTVEAAGIAEADRRDGALQLVNNQSGLYGPDITSESYMNH